MSCIKDALGFLMLSVICELSQVTSQIDNGHYVEGASPPPPPPPIQIGRGTLYAAHLRETLVPGPEFGESPVAGPQRDEIGTRAGATNNAIGAVEVFHIRPTREAQGHLVNACLCTQGGAPFLLVRMGPNTYMRYDVPLSRLYL